MKTKILILSLSLITLTGCTETPVDPAVYYADLKASCNGNRCCLTSVIQMKNGWYQEAGSSGCKDGMQEDTLKCEWAKKWCKK